MTNSGTPEIRITPVLNGIQSQQSGETGLPASSLPNSRRTWDEDWGPIAKGPPSHQSSETRLPSMQTPWVTQPVATTPLTSLISSSSSQQQISSSCPSVDIEWPPRTTSGVSSHIIDVEKQKPNTESSSPSFDDIDPFANWPPRSSNSITGLGSATNGSIGMNNHQNGNSFFSTNNQSSGSINSQSSIGFSRQNQGNSVSTISNLNSGELKNQSSLGFMKQNQGHSASRIGNPSAYKAGSYDDKNATDIGSIFSSNKTGQTALKLAPPPLTAVGRGRGERGNQGLRSNKPKSSSGQPPLLDLL